MCFVWHRPHIGYPHLRCHWIIFKQVQCGRSRRVSVPVNITGITTHNSDYGVEATRHNDTKWLLMQGRRLHSINGFSLRLSPTFTSSSFSLVPWNAETPQGEQMHKPRRTGIKSEAVLRRSESAFTPVSKLWLILHFTYNLPDNSICEPPSRVNPLLFYVRTRFTRSEVRLSGGWQE